MCHWTNKNSNTVPMKGDKALVIKKLELSPLNMLLNYGNMPEIPTGIVDVLSNPVKCSDGCIHKSSEIKFKGNIYTLHTCLLMKLDPGVDHQLREEPLEIDQVRSLTAKDI